jgi:hypothetical protein
LGTGATPTRAIRILSADVRTKWGWQQAVDTETHQFAKESL